MGRWAMITGATAGIGHATALLMAKNKWNLILTGRRDQRLKKIKTHLQENFAVNVHSLCFDVSDRSACEKAMGENSAMIEKVSVLINNAGLARGIDPMQTAQLDDWDVMIDTNVKGLLYITRLTLPHLIKNQPGHVINVGSVAGRWTYPGGGVYCSTKFAVRAITEGLRLDLNEHNIRVTNISPGLVETEFSEVRLQDTNKAKQVYEGLEALSPTDIAEAIHWSIDRPAHVNIQEMVIYPTAQASVTQVRREQP